MQEVSVFRLYLLRAAYLVMGVGLASSIWPHILFPPDLAAGPKSVIRALLGALSLLSLLGLRYPLQMLPMLLFELLWKVLWFLASGIPAWLGPGLDEYASALFYQCIGAAIVVPIVIPWTFVHQRYIRAPADRWRSTPA
jgi:hypothetical protein